MQFRNQNPAQMTALSSYKENYLKEIIKFSVQTVIHTFSVQIVIHTLSLSLSLSRCLCLSFFLMLLFLKYIISAQCLKTQFKTTLPVRLSPKHANRPRKIKKFSLRSRGAVFTCKHAPLHFRGWWQFKGTYRDNTSRKLHDEFNCFNFSPWICVRIKKWQ